MTRPDSPDDVSEGLEDQGLEPSESLDEDELGAAPVEAGTEPPEHWVAADRHGTTAGEESADRPLDDRLAEERPDVPSAEVPARPVAATPLEELDDSIDDELVPGEPADGQGRLIAGEDVNDGIGADAAAPEGR